MNYGFIYLWYDRKNKMFCLGSHLGSENDSYITSTGWMRNAYKKRPQDFKRRILYRLPIDDHKMLLREEQRWLDMIPDSELSTSENVIAGTNRYYNMKKTARGGNGSANLGQTKETTNRWAWNAGTKADPKCMEAGRKTSEKLRGKLKSEAHKAALSKAAKERWAKRRAAEAALP